MHGSITVHMRHDYEKIMIHELLLKRYSTRRFAARKVEDEKIERLFEAARWAPSSMNEQPWRFLIGERGDENFDKIIKVLNEKNRVWASNAPLLILTMTRLYSSRNNKLNKHSYYDLGGAAAHLTFQATAMGLYVRQMGGFDPDKARYVFEIPDVYSPVSVLAVGYKSDEPVELLKRERKELSEIVFTDKFGVPYNFAAVTPAEYKERE